MTMIPPAESLLKYSNPELVSKDTEDSPTPAISDPDPPPPKSTSPTPTAIDQQTEDILNFILPPREWMEDSQLWVQHVSSTPGIRSDIIQLQRDLDFRLQQRQAKYLGICPVRRELYTECFDELIRQVTINCVERGLLLLRVRDEIRMTIAAYQTLYENSVADGMKHALQVEQQKADTATNIAELDNEKRELERQLNEQKAECEAIEKRENDRRRVEEKNRAEEIQCLSRINQQLKAQFNAIFATKEL